MDQTPTDERPPRGVRARLIETRAKFRAVPGGAIVWRIGITLVGVAIIVVGVILLPLPGPGWLIIFGGLGLLSTEYAWASRLLTRAHRFVARWARWVAGQSGLLRLVLGGSAFAFLAALVVGSWYLYTLT